MSKPSDAATYQARLKKWPNSWLPNAIAFDDDVNDTEARIFWKLQLWGGKDGRVWMNRARLAEELKVSKRTLKRRLNRLVKAGWIDRSIEQPGGQFAYPRYVLQLRRTKRGVTEVAPHDRVVTGEGVPDVAPPGGPDVAPQKEQKKGTTPSEKGALPSGALPPAEPALAEEEAKPEVGGVNKGVTSDTKTKGVKTPLPDDSVERAKENARAKKREAGLSPGEVDGRPDIKKAEPEPATPKSKRRGHPMVWPPQDGRDVYLKWNELMQERDSQFEPIDPGIAGKKTGAGLNLLKAFPDPGLLERVMRVAIWDWRALQGSVKAWQTKDEPIPTPEVIYKIAEQLAGYTKTGYVTGKYPRSAYHDKFVVPLPPAPIDENGLTLAQQAAVARGEEIIPI